MELAVWQVLVLAVIQGITEFLPVSSSGHLVVAAALMAEGDVDALDVADVNIVLHLGTLVAIFVFYWNRIWRLLDEDRRTVKLLLVATLPAVAAGLPLKLAFDHWLSSARLTGALLLVTGGMLLVCSRLKRGDGRYQDLSFGRTLLIGISQACAILPGLSRSGATITCGLATGLTPQAAATFSFLMAIPAIGGAGVMELVSMLSNADASPSTTGAGTLVLGAAVSFVVGLGALSWLIRWLERGQLQWFAWWCFPVGLAVLVWLA